MNYAFESNGISCGSSPSSFSMHIKEKVKQETPCHSACTTSKHYIVLIDL